MLKMVDELFKIVIIGESNVGKSNIMTRYVANEFLHDSFSTIGVEFMTKVLKINNRTIKLQIWDTAGQERFRVISRSIYHGAKGVMIVYDITNQNSFDRIQSWHEEIKMHVAPEIPIYIIGNKNDLEHMRCVSTLSASSYAINNGLQFIETSALSSNNIDIVFSNLAKQIIERNIVQPNPKQLYVNKTVPKPAHSLSIKISQDIKKSVNKENKCDC